MVELILRLYVHRVDFFSDGMNLLDFVLVTLDTFLNLLGLLVGGTFPVSFLRVVRLSKLARVAKVEVRYMPDGTEHEDRVWVEMETIPLSHLY